MEIIGNMETRVETTVAVMVMIMVETMTTITNPKHQRIDAPLYRAAAASGAPV